LPLRQRRDTPDWGRWSVKEGVTYAHAPEHALLRALALRVHFRPLNGEEWVGAFFLELRHPEF